MANSKNQVTQVRVSGETGLALDRLNGLVVEGLRHGFFEYSIGCELGNSGKRRLVIRAGKSHKFTIPEEELTG